MFSSWTKTEAVNLGVDIYESPNGDRVEVKRDSTYDAALAAAREVLRRSKEEHVMPSQADVAS
jgi:hypothetical protein